MAHAEQYSYCGELMLGMTSVKQSKADLIDKVDAMFPNGSTNQGIGLAWAWLTHATTGPFPAPAKDSNFSYQDVIILLTDGLNTQSRYAGNGSNHSTAVDDRQALMCTEHQGRAGSRSSPCRLRPTAMPQSSMLKNCTSEPNNPNYFSYITQASQMTVKFQNIFKELSKLRVSSAESASAVQLRRKPGARAGLLFFRPLKAFSLISSASSTARRRRRHS